MSRNLAQPQTDVAQLKADHIIASEMFAQKSYHITIVTPMFGGGYESGKVDEERPVRESTIRGQLRFWWRATRGAAIASAYELRKREAEIFGDTSCPSSVKVKVELLSTEKAGTYMPGKKGNTLIPPYLFQRSNDNNQRNTSLKYIPECTFRLCLQWSAEAKALEKTKPLIFEELNHDLKAALWAWINFGGIGARTRRGCGSLYCEEFSPTQNDCNGSNFSRWLERCIKDYRLDLSVANHDREWPTLNRNMLLRFKSGENVSIWKYIIGRYKEFRRRASQIEFYNSKGEKVVKAGRSYWPEADSIRKTLDMAHPKHDTPTHFFRSNPKEEVTAFPRAELGMPIIFQFGDVSESPGYTQETNLKKRNNREPYKTELTPANKERLASPLILKTLAFNEKCGVGLIAVLNHPPLENLELKVVEKGEQEIAYSVTMNSKDLDYPNSPMRDKRQKVHPSAIDAFLNSKEVEAFCNPTNHTNT